MEKKEVSNQMGDATENEKVENEETTTPSSETMDDTLEPTEAEQGQEETSAEGETIAEEEETKLLERISELENELAEMKNRYLRAQADLENFRRRTRKEKEEQAKYAGMALIKELLPALDNLERALDASRDGNSSDGLAKGVEMVNQQIFDILSQAGLKVIPAVGEPFNPEFHEAVMQVESDEFDSGIVVEELQKGYQMKDRVIRASMVKVSK